MISQGLAVVHAFNPAIFDAYMVVALLVSIAVLDALGVAMPRGDRIAVSGAVCAAAMLMVGVWTGAAIALCGLLIAQVVRVRSLTVLSTVSELLSRGSAIAGALICVLVLASTGQNPESAAARAAIPAVYLLCELAGAQLATSLYAQRGFARLIRGNIQAQWSLLVAEWCAAVLLLITYGGMGPWSLVPVVALILLTQQSYSLLLEVRETYRTTVQVLVEAAEAQDQRRVGHADRSAAIARTIAMRLGLSAAEVERISYAALLHDVDSIAGEAVDRGRSSLRTIEGRSASIVADAKFFSNVVPILRLSDGDLACAESAGEAELVAAFIVCLASDADAAQDSAVAQAHGGNSVDRVVRFVNPQIKARVVSAALSLGLRTPAVN